MVVFDNSVFYSLGGAGLATWYFFDELEGDRFISPENKPIFMTGPLTGTPCLSTGRCIAVAKSPFTGFWGAFKKSGFNGVIIEGISPKSVCLAHMFISEFGV